MKVSINWLKEYTDIDISVDELVQKIGTQLGAVEEVIDLGKKYQGIIIAKVVSCQKHPNADKLSICTIDDGGAIKDVARDENGHVQVVCGAPNVRDGLLVAWLPPGVTVPATFDKDPFILEVRELRGEVSNGMLASSSELSLSDDHSGILEIEDEKAKPGDDFAKTFGLDDYIIDIENKMFTHRPDLFGILGIAREIAGILQKPFASPNWYAPAPEPLAVTSEELKLEIKNELPELVPRFSAVVMSNITIAPSPVWLQILLSKLGVKSINNIVDYTNYYMYLTAQPLHAYDYDKVKARSGTEATIVVRRPAAREKIKLLNGKEIEPRSEAIMIATDKQLIGIGGVMGGSETEVDERTKNIILECANFDMYSIRRTAMEHGLFTDAVTRFTKGQSPRQNLAVITKIVKEIQDNAGGKTASNMIDVLDCDKINMTGFHDAEVPVTSAFINSRLGLELSSEQIEQLLKNVEFGIEKDNGTLAVCVPFWRTDIEIPEDIVEEVGRLYGYDHLPMDLPKRTIVPVGPDALLRLKHELRTQLAGAGANEILAYSFVHGNLLEKTGQDNKLAFKITNALSPDLQYYRLSLTPSILDKVHQNIKAGTSEFALFEIGKTHVKGFETDEGVPKEFERLALVFASQAEGAAPYYQVLALMADCVHSRFGGIRFVPLKDSNLLDHKALSQMVAPYDLERSALVYTFDDLLGVIGEFRAPVKKNLKLPERTAGFELFLTPLLAGKIPAYRQLSKYPSIEHDISLKTTHGEPFGKILAALDGALREYSPEDVEITTRCIDIFSQDQEYKHTAFRVTAFSYDRTLTSEVMNQIMDKAAASLEKSIHAVRI